MKTEDPKESIENCIAFDAMDWSTNGNHAWLYGIVMGWDDDSLKSLQSQHHWSDEAVERLKRLNEKYKELK